jgi:heme-degrading monooxygenase HmoA
MKISSTPTPPYYAVIFTSLRTDGDNNYAATAQRMEELAMQHPGFLGIESARSELGITVCYWSSLEAIQNWKQNTEHLAAQQKGKEKWYANYRIRICKVEKEYGME